MSDKVEMALQAYRKGANCAQSVASAFAQEMGLSKQQVYRLTESFGGGVGGMQEICGALSGAFMVIGFLNSDGTESAHTKPDTYKHVRKEAQKFKDKFGSLRCYDLLNGQRPQHLKCSDYIEQAVYLVEDYINERNN